MTSSKRLAAWLALGLLLAAGAVEAADFPVPRDFAFQSEGATATTTHPIPNPNWTVAGDRVFVLSMMSGSSAVTWPSSSYCTGSAWSTLATATASDDALWIFEVRYCDLASVMTGTQNITTGASQRGSMVVFVLMKGTFATQAPEVGTAALGAGSTSVDPPPVTPTWGSADNIWIVFVGNGTGTQAPRLAIAGGPDLNFSRLASTAGNNAASTATGASWRFLTGTTLDPGTNILNYGSSVHSVTNTIAQKGQALPSGGGASYVIGGGM